ncbi:hypothetical protein [Arthrobacter sp.]|uniref:hypothetical protein n=1 Tax=Arthrobacter sp. TaxID=1667 RepID=UPI00339A6B31
MNKSTAVLLATTALLLGGCAAPTAAPAPVVAPGDADIVANAGKAGSPTSLTLDEAKALLPELGKIHPDLAEPRELTDARSTCGDIQAGKDAATVAGNAGQRFGNGTTRVLTADQAALVVAAIRANGFCETP